MQRGGTNNRQVHSSPAPITEMLLDRSTTGGTEARAALARRVSSSGRFSIQTSARLDAFDSCWPTLSQLGAWPHARGFAFQCRDHLAIWLETIGAAGGVQPYIVSVSDAEGNLLMHIPLGIWRSRGIRTMEFLDGGVCDFNAPILFRPGFALERREVLEIWDTVCRASPGFDVGRLEKCPEFIAEVKNPLYALVTCRVPMAGHMVHLGNVTKIDQIQKDRDFKDSRRQRRRITELGELKLILASASDEIDSAMAAFVRQKSRRYMETIGSPGFDVAGQLSYYATLAKRLSGRGVQLSYLKVGETIVTAAWSLIAAGRFYYLMCSYEGGSWKAVSPGRILLEELIEWCLSHEIEIFDFGIGDESYKLTWRQTDCVLGRTTFSRTFWGYVLLGLERMARGARRQVPRSWIVMAKKLVARRPRPLSPPAAHG
jgi:CelD/BcsL family acetyltransferase involved in cellulose biosynthesis